MIKPTTNKLVMKTRNHMQQRGIHIFDHFNIQSYACLCHNVNICSLCFTLVFEEAQLMDTERKFAIFQNINVGVDMIKVECQADKHHQQLFRPPLISKNLFQWRIMFYFKILDQIPQGIFHKHLKYYIQYKIFDQIIAVKMYMNKIDMQKKALGRDLLTSALVVYILNMISAKREYSYKYIPLDMIKMHFFFTEGEDDPGTFLKNLRISFRITKSLDWNEDVLLKGESQIFLPIIHTDHTNVGGDYMQRPLTFQQNITLFTGDKEKLVELKMVVGVAKDSPVMDTSGINLYGEHPVYWTDERYYSHQPFPDTFIDVFYQYLERENALNAELKKIENEESRTYEFKDESSILDPMTYEAELMKRFVHSHEMKTDFHTPSRPWTNHGEIPTKLPGRPRQIRASINTFRTRPRSAQAARISSDIHDLDYGTPFNPLVSNLNLSLPDSQAKNETTQTRTTDQSTNNTIFEEKPIVYNPKYSKPPRTQIRVLKNVQLPKRYIYIHRVYIYI